MMYQIRLPQRLDLEHWVNEVTWALWHEFVHHLGLHPLGPRAVARMREMVQGLLEGHVTSYDRCGTGAPCWIGTEASPWTGKSRHAFRPSEPKVRWYILELEYGLDELVWRATDQLEAFLADQTSDVPRHSVLESSVGIALQQAVGRYLYANPHCGAHLFCRDSVRRDPWGQPGSRSDASQTMTV